MLVINGKRVPVEGVTSKCFLDDRTLGFTNPRDFRLRKKPTVQSIVVHTRMGIWPQEMVSTVKDRHWDEIGVRNASRDNRIASWHVSVDADGSFVCHLDLALVAAYHAEQLNEVSVGIEMYQDRTGNISEATLETTVKLLDTITREFGIQRQFVREDKISVRFAHNKRFVTGNRKLAYMKGGRSGEDFYGILGHRNVTRNRGKGDPGDFIFDKLADAGYESFFVDQEADLTTWKYRQKHNLRGYCHSYDGIPGPVTTEALRANGYKHGLYVERPGD